MGQLIKTFNLGGFKLTEPLFTWDEPYRFDYGINDNTCHGLIPLINNLNKKYKRGLDIGTAIGTLALTMSKKCDSVIGIDIIDRALEFANRNKEINKINNVKFIHSDLYNNIKGKFDLIISNPNFVFCPNDAGADWYYGYCGDLGMETELKIIEGFKNHLAKNGEAYLILSSSIIFNENILINRLRNYFYLENFDYEIEMKELSLYYIKELHSFYKQHNIDYFILYLAHIKNNNKQELKIIKLNFLKRVAMKINIYFKKRRGE